MGCGTVFISTLIGFFVFNIPGAIIGAFIGFVLNSSSNNQGNSYYSQSSRRQSTNSQMYFYKQLFGMLAKMAQADGAVTRQEINIVDRFTEEELNLPPALKKEVIKYFDQAKRSDTTFESYARKFYQIIGNQPNILARVVELMNQIADTNGGASSKQTELLEKAVNIFRLNSRRSYHRQYNRSNNNGSQNSYSKKVNGKDPYEILGCSKDDSTKEIKKKYRELVKEYHPDKIISKDLPDEFVELANKRFKEIQNAYEEIMKMRGEKK
ncbi:MAG: DnaJ domain-containing protein [Bacillota bacterium]